MMNMKKKRKTICQILIEHKDGSLLTIKRSAKASVHPDEIEIAIYDEMLENEQVEDAVKRIVLEQTGMHCDSFKSVYEDDICLGNGSIKKCMTCVVDNKKDELQMTLLENEQVQWIPAKQWKELLDAGKIIESQRISYHDFFFEKGVAPKYYVNENYIFEYSKKNMKQDAAVNVDIFGPETMSAYAWYSKEKDAIELYIWGPQLPEGCIKFIIKENYIWSKEKEHDFDWFAHRQLITEGIDSDMIYAIYMNRYPDLQLSYEYDEDPYRLLASLYYFFRGGAKNILFKKGLQRLAQALDEFEMEYNHMGNTPSEILFDIPFPVLQALNSHSGATLLAKTELREGLKMFYEDFPQFFKPRLSYASLCNLESILGRRYISQSVQEKNDKHTRDYAKYLENRKVLATITRNFPAKPLMQTRWWFYSKADRMVKYLRHEKEINAELKMIYAELHEKYEYQDERYKLVMPTNVREFLRSAEELLQDYWQFLEFVVHKQNCILLLYDKKKNDVLTAAVEVTFDKIDKIIDVYGKYNMDVTEEIRVWVENYAKEKNIVVIKKENEDDLPLPFD